MSVATEIIKSEPDYAAAEERGRWSRASKAERRRVSKKLADDVRVAHKNVATRRCLKTLVAVTRDSIV